MTSKTDLFAKFAEILNRKDVYIRANISGGFECYKIVSEGAVLLAVRKHTTTLPNTGKEEFTIKVCDMYSKIKDNNLNKVIVQVRTMADAIYPSDYFPWSTS